MMDAQSNAGIAPAGEEKPVRSRGLTQEVGRRIVRERKRRGWSQGDLARRLGVKRERMGNWERGENAPRLEDRKSVV